MLSRDLKPIHFYFTSRVRDVGGVGGGVADVGHLVSAITDDLGFGQTPDHWTAVSTDIYVAADHREISQTQDI